MMPTKLTVVMPVYNGEKYLSESIESILSQTFTDFEFLIIDDGSSDKTVEIIKSFDDNRIVFLQNAANLGLSKSLNIGIHQSHGNYIARQDADDISLPTRLEKQFKYLENHPKVGVIGTTTEWIDEKGDHLLFWSRPTDNISIQESLIYTCNIIHGSTMYRRQAVEEIGLYNSKLRTGQDYDLWLRLSEFWDIECLPEILYKHRRHSLMSSSVHNQQQAKNAASALDASIERRLKYARQAIFAKNKLPDRLYAMDQIELTKRFLSWALGARQYNRIVAFKFIMAAIVLDPFYQPTWSYIKGWVGRKLKMILGQEKDSTTM
jgi:glycosyltransferase involved in cell wall biosynthesis